MIHCCINIVYSNEYSTLKYTMLHLSQSFQQVQKHGAIDPLNLQCDRAISLNRHATKSSSTEKKYDLSLNSTVNIRLFKIEMEVEKITTDDNTIS